MASILQRDRRHLLSEQRENSGLVTGSKAWMTEHQFVNSSLNKPLNATVDKVIIQSNAKIIIK